ncbi:hypothetical protein [Mucilaginibacter sp.]|uniref:hypothetical protein n=1 Tax=Mucilaginibacter sp. TaxID=1882438 RepID=UPI003B00CF60
MVKEVSVAQNQLKTPQTKFSPDKRSINNSALTSRLQYLKADNRLLTTRLTLIAL